MRMSLLAAAACSCVLLLGGCGDDTSEAAGDPTSGAPSSTPAEEPTSDAPSSDAPSPDAPTSTTPPADPAPQLPACAEVWVEGEDLPARYSGCLEGSTEVPATGRGCAFGKSLETYDGRFYALPGARVNRTEGPVLQDPDYRDALRSCAG